MNTIIEILMLLTLIGALTMPTRLAVNIVIYMLEDPSDRTMFIGKRDIKVTFWTFIILTVMFLILSFIKELL